MKLTVREIIWAHEALRDIGMQRRPIQESVRITKAIAPLSREIQLVVTEVDRRRQDLLGKYATKDESGNNKVENNRFVFENGNREVFDEEYQKILDEEIDIDEGIIILKLGSIQIEPGVLLPLEKLLIG